MAKEELWLGWGAGSWRYIFPMYQKSYPEIYYQRYHPRHGWKGRRVYHYAHNDVVQFLCEYGIVGCSLAAADLWLLGAGACCFGHRATPSAPSCC